MNTHDMLAGRIDAVVIGASAGGVQALMTVLPALPRAAELSAFVVLHLPRDRPSQLAEIFGAHCAMAVSEAQDKEPAMPGHVYIAPPDYHLLVDAGPACALSDDEPVNYSRPSIDVLFESAADVFGERLLGIVLSGANDDGSRGAAAIKRAGGLVFVQDPATAPSSAMPSAAMARAAVDFVGNLDQIAGLLRSLSDGTQRPSAPGSPRA
jgi:two-component system chemotaxis response regulator CheB